MKFPRSEFGLIRGGGIAWAVAAGLLLAAGPDWKLSGATLLVYNNTDNGAGSLRQAVADNNALGGGNTIVFASNVTGAITLGLGELQINASVSIVGPGPEVLAIDANNASRIFRSQGPVVNISGLSIKNGLVNLPEGTGGGVLQVTGQLSLTNCWLLGCNARTNGGAIAQSSGTLRLASCTLSNNTSFVRGFGSGAYLLGQGQVYGCTFVTNRGDSATGGAIYHNGTSLEVVNSTFTANAAGPLNGGLGGAIWNGAGLLAATNCTFSGNRASRGGGIYGSAGGSVRVASTILAGNLAIDTGASGWSPEVYGTVSSGGYNLVGNRTNSSGFTAVGDQVGTAASPLNPSLAALANNGGPVWTMALLPGSLAIDQGKSGGITTDQRGFPRPFDKPGIPNAAGGNGADIGAFEGSTTTLVVSNLNNAGSGSLRQAVLDAVAVDSDTILFAPGLNGSIPLLSEIGIDKDLNIAGPGASVVTLNGNASTRLFSVLGGTVSISGLTLFNGRAVGTAGGFEQSGVAERGGAIWNQAALSLSDCVIVTNAVAGGTGGPTDSGFAGGGGNASGGAIANIGTLALTRCSVAANSATGGAGGAATMGGSPGNGGQGYGGGIHNGGTLLVTNCAFYGNHAVGGPGDGGIGSGSGGGIYNELNAVLVTSTVASNTATGNSFDFGGGIYDGGTSLKIRGATIAGNRAGYGGGIFSGNADLGSTILAANTITPGGTGPDGSGSLVSSDYNLVQNTSGFTLSGTTAHNIAGQDAKLGALQDNGGPTLTMSLLMGSPGIDKGFSFASNTDQRGRARRFDFTGIANGVSNDAADVGAYEASAPSLTISKAAANVLVSWPTSEGGYTLEAATNPAVAAAAWSAAGSPSVVSNRYVVTNNTAGINRFYRLRYP